MANFGIRCGLCEQAKIEEPVSLCLEYNKNYAIACGIDPASREPICQFGSESAKLSFECKNRNFRFSLPK